MPESKVQGAFKQEIEKEANHPGKSGKPPEDQSEHGEFFDEAAWLFKC